MVLTILDIDIDYEHFKLGVVEFLALVFWWAQRPSESRLYSLYLSSFQNGLSTRVETPETTRVENLQIKDL